MSEPTRYAMGWGTDEDKFVYVIPIESIKGKWVKWEECAKSQAEVERLRKHRITLIERLSKAIEDWNDANEEGKQS